LSKNEKGFTGLLIIEISTRPVCLGTYGFSYALTNFGSNKICLTNFGELISDSDEAMAFSMPLDPKDPELKKLGSFGEKIVTRLSEIEDIDEIQIDSDVLMIVKKTKAKEEELKPIIIGNIKNSLCLYCREKMTEKASV